MIRSGINYKVTKLYSQHVNIHNTKLRGKTYI